jgi:ferredoxin-type protein NapH
VSVTAQRRIGADAVAAKGRLRAQRWLLLRRAVQASVLALFLVGPWFGVWIVEGNLASSLTLGLLPLTDPYVLAQTLAAGHLPLRAAWIGAAIVLVVYLLAGGRAFCSWVCPVNPLTEPRRARTRLGIKAARMCRAGHATRFSVDVCGGHASGIVAREPVNPVSMLHRGLIFGIGAMGVAMILLFDLFVMRRGW